MSIYVYCRDCGRSLLDPSECRNARTPKEATPEPECDCRDVYEGAKVVRVPCANHSVPKT